MTSQKNYSEIETEYIRINHDKPETPYLKSEHNPNPNKSEYHQVKEEYRNLSRELEEYNKKIEGASGNKYFCVFRVGKKFKNLNMVRRYQYHVNRESNVLNADAEKSQFNRVLIGSDRIMEDVQKYIDDVPMIRSNGNIAFDLILTAHHNFFNELTPPEKEVWIQHNVDYLKKTFGDNCVSAILHSDELALHLHCLVVPKFYNEKQRRNELQSNKYLDGREKLQNFQTDYANWMGQKFKNLQRGIRGSKAVHQEPQVFYSILTQTFDVMDEKSILAYAQYGFLVQKRLKALERTLKIMEENGDSEKLLKKLDAADKKSEEYKNLTKAIIKKYRIEPKEIDELVSRVKGNDSKEREK